MHELSVALELLATCRAEVAARGGERLLSVAVRVGELSGVDPDLLAYAWEAACEEARLPGVELDLRRAAATRRCPTCGPLTDVPEPHAGPRAWLEPCPRCGDPLHVTGGRELDVLELAYAPGDDDTTTSTSTSTSTAPDTEATPCATTTPTPTTTRA